MKMKKVAVIVICFCLIFVLASCGRPITPNEQVDMSDGVLMERSEMEFTIATYNIKGGAATLQSVSKIKDNIQSVNADIAGLQEVDNLSDRTGKEDFLKIFKNNSDLKNVAYYSADLMGFNETYGIAEISKTAFDRTYSFKLPYPYKYEKADVEKRIAIRSLVKINGIQIAFYNTHLSYEDVKMPDGTSLRAAQFDFILQLLQSDPSPYKIVTGDFNVLDFSEYDKLLASGYNIVNNKENQFNTYRGTDVSFNAIDNIIYSNSLQLLESGMFDDDCSDHNMLYAKFKTLK